MRWGVSSTLSAVTTLPPAPARWVPNAEKPWNKPGEKARSCPRQLPRPWRAAALAQSILPCPLRPTAGLEFAGFKPGISPALEGAHPKPLQTHAEALGQAASLRTSVLAVELLQPRFLLVSEENPVSNQLPGQGSPEGLSSL